MSLERTPEPLHQGERKKNVAPPQTQALRYEDFRMKVKPAGEEKWDISKVLWHPVSFLFPNSNTMNDDPLMFSRCSLYYFHTAKLFHTISYRLHIHLSAEHLENLYILMQRSYCNSSQLENEKRHL